MLFMFRPGCMSKDIFNACPTIRKLREFKTHISHGCAREQEHVQAHSGGKGSLYKQ